MRNSFYFVFRDVGLKPVHQSVNTLSWVADHGSVVDIDPCLVALRVQEAVGVFRVPFGVTCAIVDIKATMLDSCRLLPNVFLISLRSWEIIEMIHHCSIFRCFVENPTANVVIVGALVRRCCNLVFIER